MNERCEMKPSVIVIQTESAEEKISKIRVASYCRVSSDLADQLKSFMVVDIRAVFIACNYKM